MTNALSCSTVWGGQAAIDRTFEIPGMDGAIYSRPADGDAGGDIHLVSVCAHGCLSKIVLADVSGHGGEVARIGATLHELLEAHLNEPDNDRFLVALNDRFEATPAVGRGTVFATLAATSYYIGDGVLRYAYAGHPQIIRRHAGGLQTLNLPADRGDAIANLPIGVMDGARFYEGEQKMARGDWLVLFSDGVVETRSGDGEQFGIQRLGDILSAVDAQPPGRVLRSILDRLEDFAAPRSLDQDDLTLIVLRINPDAKASGST
jgi:serine phosphatase RsbU (regulator of sigma subunit)